MLTNDNRQLTKAQKNIENIHMILINHSEFRYNP